MAQLFASSFSILFFFGSLASNAVIFQTISINRQNKDTKNDPETGEGHFVSVYSLNKLVTAGPTTPKGVISFTGDLRTSFAHTSG